MKIHFYFILFYFLLSFSIFGRKVIRAEKKWFSSKSKNAGEEQKHYQKEATRNEEKNAIAIEKLREKCDNCKGNQKLQREKQFVLWCNRLSVCKF